MRDTITQQLIDGGAVAIVRMQDSQRLMRVAEAIHEGGVSSIEITMTVPNALAMIEEVAREMGGEILLGVGSVIDADTTRRAIEAGARYVVSPVFKPEVIEAAHAQDAPALPGAFTPTEIQAAHEAGADIVKVFPANVLGKAFIKGVLAPLPHLKLAPTGGVTPANAGEWITAGASAVGVGSALLDKKAIAEGNYAVLTEKARILKQSIDSSRRSRD